MRRVASLPDWKIRELRKSLVPPKVLADDYGLSKADISLIQRGGERRDLHWTAEELEARKKRRHTGTLPRVLLWTGKMSKLGA